MDETIEIEVANGICTRRALAARLRRVDAAEWQALCDVHGQYTAQRLAARICDEAETQAVSGARVASWRNSPAAESLHLLG